MQNKKRQGLPKRGKGPETGEQREARRYRAPALEKGLDILELLASEAKPPGRQQRLHRFLAIEQSVIAW